MSIETRDKITIIII